MDERLRDAAVSIFLENGYDGTTMEAVADAAGITKRTLYARYPDKHALFVSVIPWALSRLESATPVRTAGDDLAAALTAVGRGAIARVVDPDDDPLRRMAMYESARFPEFAHSAESMMYSAQLRAVVAVLRQHHETDALVIDDIELAAEQFLAMVAVMPSRLADFGIVRSPEVEDRHLRACGRAVPPRHPAALNIRHRLHTVGFGLGSSRPPRTPLSGCTRRGGTSI